MDEIYGFRQRYSNVMVIFIIARPVMSKVRPKIKMFFIRYPVRAIEIPLSWDQWQRSTVIGTQVVFLSTGFYTCTSKADDTWSETNWSERSKSLIIIHLMASSTSDGSIKHSLARSLYLLRHWEETSHDSETRKVRKEVWAWPAHTSSCKKYKSVGPKLKNQVVWEFQLVRSELCSWSVHPHCPHKATGMYLSTLWSSSSYVHLEL